MSQDMTIPTDAELEPAARAYDPVGWEWYDRRNNGRSPDDEHPAGPEFYRNAIDHARAAIAAWNRRAPAADGLSEGEWADIHTALVEGAYGRGLAPIRDRFRALAAKIEGMKR